VQRRVLACLGACRPAVGRPGRSCRGGPPSTSPVATFAGTVVGTSTLARTGSGITFSLQTSGLQAGHAVTVWWMLFNPNGSLSVQYAAGHVVEGGVAGIGGALWEGDSEGGINGGPGLLDATAAHVVLVVRDHGPPRLTSSSGRSTPSTSAVRGVPICSARCPRWPVERRLAGEWAAPPPRPTRRYQALPHHQLGGSSRRHQPVMRAGDHPRQRRAACVLASRATQPSAMVTDGPQRSVASVSELRHLRLASRPTVPTSLTVGGPGFRAGPCGNGQARRQRSPAAGNGSVLAVLDWMQRSWWKLPALRCRALVALASVVPDMATVDTQFSRASCRSVTFNVVGPVACIEVATRREE
jgi:hypothetical protein